MGSHNSDSKWPNLGEGFTKHTCNWWFNSLDQQAPQDLCGAWTGAMMVVAATPEQEHPIPSATGKELSKDQRSNLHRKEEAHKMNTNKKKNNEMLQKSIKNKDNGLETTQRIPVNCNNLHCVKDIIYSNAAHLSSLLVHLVADGRLSDQTNIKLIFIKLYQS